MISADNLSQVPIATCLGFITNISNPATQRNKSVTAVTLALSRAVLTVNNDAFDATVSREAIAELTTASYSHPAGGFIITSIANIKNALLGLEVPFHCPDTSTDYVIKIKDYTPSTSGKKRNNTIFKLTANIKAGSADAIANAQNTAIVTDTVKHFLAMGNCDLLDVRRGGNGIVNFPFYYVDFKPKPGLDFNVATMVAGRDGLPLPSGNLLYIKWNKELLEQFPELCPECLYTRCACGYRGHGKYLHHAHRDYKGPSGGGPSGGGAPPRPSKAARLARYD